MKWFYLQNEEQRGPVGDEEFQALVAPGTIQPATPVRRGENSDWQPFETLAGAAPSRCALCGAAFGSDGVVEIAGATVCARCKPVQLQRLREGAIPDAVQALRYAGVWIRGLAALIDAVILFSVSIGLSMLTGVTFSEAISFVESDPERPLWSLEDNIWFATDFLFGACYETIFVAAFAGTPGKRLCRLRIVRADGGRLTIQHALARSLAEWVSILPCGLGYLVAAFDKEKRALHDLICHTRVVWAARP
jgi:uncharacterized RDD family membrane protein YckC